MSLLVGVSNAVTKWAISLGLVMCGCGSCVGWVQAEEIRFITIETAPWAWKENNRVQGVCPDVLAELQRRSGHNLSLVVQPLARVRKQLRHGDKDCTMLAWIQGIADIVERGAVVTQVSVGAVMNVANPVRTYADLQGKTLSVLRGLPIDEMFDQDPLIIKQYDTDYRIGVRKAAFQRVAGVVGVMTTIRFVARKLGAADQLGGQWVMTKVPVGIQCAKASPKLHLMPELSQQVMLMLEDGSIEAIKARYQFE